jgi:hypothetical protein
MNCRLDSNINLQMNYWFAEMTGMGDLAIPLFNYIEVGPVVASFTWRT